MPRRAAAGSSDQTLSTIARPEVLQPRYILSDNSASVTASAVSQRAADTGEDRTVVRGSGPCSSRSVGTGRAACTSRRWSAGQCSCRRPAVSGGSVSRQPPPAPLGGGSQRPRCPGHCLQTQIIRRRRGGAVKYCHQIFTKKYVKL